MLGYKSGNSLVLYFGSSRGTDATRWAALTEYWTTPTEFGAPKNSNYLVTYIYRENKTIYWYSDSGAGFMYNNSGVTYYWMAFC